MQSWGMEVDEDIWWGLLVVSILLMGAMTLQSILYSAQSSLFTQETSIRTALLGWTVPLAQENHGMTFMRRLKALLYLMSCKISLRDGQNKIQKQLMPSSKFMKMKIYVW